VNRLESWSDRPAVSAADLAVFRVLFAVTMLLLLPTARFARHLPETGFAPPPGPFALLPTYPPDAVVIGFEIVAALALVALALGWHTPRASAASGLLLLFVTGLHNSFGQVDHVAMFGAIPLILSVSGWGNTRSLDAARGRQHVERPWTQRLLALTIGVAFLVAAIPKIESGWLELQTQAAHGHLLRRVLAGDNTGPLGDLIAGRGPWLIWESLDWMTVGLEVLVVLSVVAWRSFRLGIAFAAIFHGLVLVLLGIPFPAATLAYAAFIPWTRLPVPRTLLSRIPRTSGAVATPLVLTAVPIGAAGAWTLAALVPDFGISVAVVVVLAGTVAGAIFLAIVTKRIVGRVRAWSPEDRAQARVWAARIVAVALLGVLPAQYFLFARVGETYPALQQPGFSQPRLSNGELRFSNVPVIVVTFDDGTTESPSGGKVLPSPLLQQSVIFRNLFKDKAGARRPEVVAWLEGRLAELYPGRTPVKFRIGWSNVYRDAFNGEVLRVEERYDVVVDLGPER
jgi:hypothetical protein